MVIFTVMLGRNWLPPETGVGGNVCGIVGGGCDCGEHSPICLSSRGKGFNSNAISFFNLWWPLTPVLYLFSALNFYTLLLCPPQAVSMLLHVSSLCLSMSTYWLPCKRRMVKEFPEITWKTFYFQMNEKQLVSSQDFTVLAASGCKWLSTVAQNVAVFRVLWFYLILQFI